jgi:hypothetical protein
VAPKASSIVLTSEIGWAGSTPATSWRMTGTAASAFEAERAIKVIAGDGDCDYAKNSSGST